VRAVGSVRPIAGPTKRVFVQFGIAAVAVALTTGVALADGNGATTTPPTASQSASTQCATTTTVSGSVQVQSSTSCDSGSTAGSGTSGSTTGTTTPSGLSSGVTPPGSTGGTTTLPITHDPSSNLSDPTAAPGVTPPPTTTPPTTPTNSTTSTTPAAAIGSNTGSGGSGSVTSAATIASVDRAAATAATSLNPPVLLASSGPAMPQPTSPKAPVSLLNQFHLLLSQVVVPGGLALPPLSLPVAELAGTVLAIIVFLIVAPAPTNTHTARLRRSGFLGAARSDVAAATTFFATPREMSFIGAYAP
jgi:hypothetical protein